MKTRVRNGFNSMMAFILSLFGFGCFSCGMYGTPHAELEISGRIRNKNKEPLEEIRVTVKTDEEERIGVPRVYTDEYGKYNTGKCMIFPRSYVDIIVEDPAGVYERDSVRVDVEYNRLGVTEPFHKGKAHIERDFQLQAK